MKIGKTAKFYRDNPEAAEKRRKYQREYNKSEERKKYRAFLNKKNREAGTYGNGDGKDWDHGERKFISAKKNRSKKWNMAKSASKRRSFKGLSPKSVKKRAERMVNNEVVLKKTMTPLRSGRTSG